MFGGEKMNKDEDIVIKARAVIGPYCKACSICDGRACHTLIPGPGSQGDVAIRNYQAWQEISLVLDTLYERGSIDASTTLFNQPLRIPVIAGPVGAVNLHYGDTYCDETYNHALVSACAKSGILAMTGDGINPEVMRSSCAAIADVNGRGIPTVKPWHLDVLKEKLRDINAVKPCAIAMDIDAAGLPFLKNTWPQAGSKSVAELRDVINLCEAPFIVKGIMSVKGALKAKEAGAKAIVVSNHGGRVLPDCEPTAHVLKDICDAVGNEMVVLVDGGIRHGKDIFKALALGADGVIIARPFVVRVYGDATMGVETYVSRLEQELKDVMLMCGANRIEDITFDMVKMLR